VFIREIIDELLTLPFAGLSECGCVLVVDRTSRSEQLLGGHLKRQKRFSLEVSAAYGEPVPAWPVPKEDSVVPCPPLR